MRGLRGTPREVTCLTKVVRGLGDLQEREPVLGPTGLPAGDLGAGGVAGAETDG